MKGNNKNPDQKEDLINSSSSDKDQKIKNEIDIFNYNESKYNNLIYNEIDYWNQKLPKLKKELNEIVNTISKHSNPKTIFAESQKFIDMKQKLINEINNQMNYQAINSAHQVLICNAIIGR